MPVAYISNKVQDHNYDFFHRDGLNAATITFGSRLDIEEIARMLSVSERTDVLVLDGSPLISAVCLCLWLEKHDQCCLYTLDSVGIWRTNLISRTSMRRIIENVQDEVTNGRSK